MPDVTVETTNVDQLKSAVLSVDLNRLHFYTGRHQQTALLKWSKNPKNNGSTGFEAGCKPVLFQKYLDIEIHRVFVN